MPRTPTDHEAAGRSDLSRVSVLAYRTPTRGVKRRGATLAARRGAVAGIVLLLGAVAGIYSESRHLRDGIDAYLPALIVALSGVAFFVLIALGRVGSHTRRDP